MRSVMVFMPSHKWIPENMRQSKQHRPKRKSEEGDVEQTKKKKGKSLERAEEEASRKEEGKVEQEVTFSASERAAVTTLANANLGQRLLVNGYRHPT